MLAVQCFLLSKWYSAKWHAHSSELLPTNAKLLSVYGKSNHATGGMAKYHITKPSPSEMEFVMASICDITTCVHTHIPCIQ